MYIRIYGREGVSVEFANFITGQFVVKRIENTLEQYHDTIIVAEYKSNLVGVAELEFAKKCPIDDVLATELNKLYILEWFWGLGIGQNLLQKAENLVQEGVNPKCGCGY